MIRVAWEASAYDKATLIDTKLHRHQLRRVGVGDHVFLHVTGKPLPIRSAKTVQLAHKWSTITKG